MIVAVDTGGTKTLIVGFDDDGKIVEEIKFPTPKQIPAYVRLVSQTLNDSFRGKKVDAVVFGIPGIIKNGVALWCNNLKWKNFDVKKAFTGVLGAAPILVENDANLAGLSEVRQMKDTPPYALYITVSTGIGGGVIMDGRISPHLQQSEIGLSKLEYKGRLQLWEKFASGKAVFKTYKKYARDIKNKRDWQEIADRISKGLLVIIPTLQPPVIIIGGSMGTHFDKYGDFLKDILRKKLHEHIPLPKIIKAKHPEMAVIYGCYYHATNFLTD